MTNPTHNDLLINIGRLEAGLAAVKEDSKQTRQDVREIRDAMASTKGGWRVLLAVASVAGAVGAMLSQAAPWLWPIPK